MKKYWRLTGEICVINGCNGKLKSNGYATYCNKCKKEYTDI